MKKTILSIIILLGIGALAYLMLTLQKNTEKKPEPENTTYTNSELGVSFVVPAGYTTKEISPTNSSDLIKTISIISNDDAQKDTPSGGEGPVSITVNAFKNARKQFPTAWAQKNTQYSNLNLKTSSISEKVVGGANAIGYTADGLYPAEVVVVAHGDFMYVITGQFTDPQSPMRATFQNIINSLNFIPTPGQVSGKIDINAVCQGALAYTTFTDGASAEKFVQDCTEGKHPEVIEKFKADSGLGDGAAI